MDTEALKIAVANLPYDNVGETRIDLGLELANEMFAIENGARGSSKKVCFILGFLLLLLLLDSVEYKRILDFLLDLD